MVAISTKQDIQDAIKYIEQELESVKAFPAQVIISIQEERKNLEVAIEALDKQIPKKPIGDLHSVPHYRCPICQFGIVMYEESMKYPYCHHCGQAIQWEE